MSDPTCLDSTMCLDNCRSWPNQCPFKSSGYALGFLDDTVSPVWSSSPDTSGTNRFWRVAFNEAIIDSFSAGVGAGQARCVRVPTAGCPDANGNGTPDCQECDLYDVVGTFIQSPLQFLPDDSVTADFANPNWWNDDTHACYQAYQNPSYVPYFPGCDPDGSGIVEDTEILNIYYFATHLGGLSVDCASY